MNDITKNLLELISDLSGVPGGAYNIREDGQCAARPVSYTHLDVYKRQQRFCRLPPSRLSERNPLLRPLRFTGFSLCR